MPKSEIGRVSLEYLILRVANVLIRPLTLFAFAAVSGDFIASVVALAFTFGGWLMAPMSVGSYRWVLPVERKFNTTRGRNEIATGAYSVLVCFSIGFFVPITFAAVYLILGDISAASLASLVVFYDFLTQEQSRRIIYGGRLVRWARFLIVRNIAIPVMWIIGFLVAGQYYGAPLKDDLVTSLLPLATIPPLLIVLVGFMRSHMLFLSFSTVKEYAPLAWKRIQGHWQYALAGILTKSHQHMDKLLIAILLPESIWMVAIVNYLASIPVLAYEMINFARLKSEVLDLTGQQAKHRRKISLRDLVTIAIFGIPAGAGIIVFLTLQGLDEIAGLVSLIYLAFSSIYIISLKRSELLFWVARNKWTLFKVDLIAGSINLLLAFLILFLGPSLYLVKIPSLMGAIAKNYLADSRIKSG